MNKLQGPATGIAERSRDGRYLPKKWTIGDGFTLKTTAATDFSILVRKFLA